MKYRVLKPWGTYKAGDVIEEDDFGYLNPGVPGMGQVVVESPKGNFLYPDWFEKVTEESLKTSTQYQVNWAIHETVQTECPDYIPDPYTGMYPDTHCLVLHYKNIEREFSRIFPSREEAEEFVKGATSNCKNFKIIEGLSLHK